MKNDPNWVMSCSGYYGKCKPQNLLNGCLDYNADKGKGFNASTGFSQVDWVSFDFGEQKLITKFAIYSLGDVTHDPKVFDLQISEDNESWKTIVSFVGKPGTAKRQEFVGFRAKSRYWKWKILSRYSGWQTVCREVEFYTEGS
jgi:hypothetical protein